MIFLQAFSGLIGILLGCFLVTFMLLLIKNRVILLIINGTVILAIILWCTYYLNKYGVF